MLKMKGVGLRNSRVVITSVLDPIFCKICPATGSGPPAIRGCAFNIFGGFRLRTGSGPLTTCGCPSTILVRE